MNVILSADEHVKLILATIIAKNGSSPRGIGSRMIIKEDGTIVGSIGGGNVEYQAVLEAVHLKESVVRDYVLSNKEGGTLGMVCGGNIRVLLEIL